MKFAVFVSVDVVAMEIISIFIGKLFGLQMWKRVLLPLLFGATGVVGVKLMYFIENGKFGGMSYFGIIFISPLLLIAIAPIMKMQIGTMLDIAAPCECITLAIQKIECLTTGCCKGMIIRFTTDGEAIRFPSQLVEMINGMILTAILIYLIIKAKHKNRVFFIYMVAYGLTRYGLNWLRETEPAVWFLPFGTIWSILSALIGSIVLFVIRYKKNGLSE